MATLSVAEAAALAAELSATFVYGKMVMDNHKAEMDQGGAGLELKAAEMVLDMQRLTANLSQRVARTHR